MDNQTSQNNSSPDSISLPELNKKVDDHIVDFVNHKHRDYDKTPKLDVITSISKSGTKITGDVTFSGAVSQSGQNFNFTGLTTAYDYQVFTATGSGAWTKPTGATANSKVYVQMWGAGGGSGGANGTGSSNTGGGGGGEFKEISFLASTLAGTVSLNVGAGGTAGANTGGNAGNGGATTFAGATNTITARGGLGSLGSVTGAGAGGLGAGYFPQSANTPPFDALDDSTGGTGGGGGATTGGASVKGGGGGAGASSVSTTGGLSVLGGNGADSGINNHAGSDGNAPGGGASGARQNGAGNQLGGVGARGEIRIWTFF